MLVKRCTNRKALIFIINDAGGVPDTEIKEEHTSTLNFERLTIMFEFSKTEMKGVAGAWCPSSDRDKKTINCHAVSGFKLLGRGQAGQYEL